MAHAGALGAAYNVRINLRHIKDAEFGAEMRSQLKATLAECHELEAKVEAKVEQVLGA